jgi:large subunit ribosomal protein L15
MRLNTLKPGSGSKRTRRRVGRGASAGQGKTSGRGVKGQRARKGGYHKVMPKVGFRSAMKALRAEVRLDELAKVKTDVIDLAALKAANVVSLGAKQAKVVLSGEIKRAITLKGVGATKGAKAAIEAAGGKIEA